MRNRVQAAATDREETGKEVARTRVHAEKWRDDTIVTETKVCTSMNAMKVKLVRKFQLWED